jgi:outer membrane protein
MKRSLPIVSVSLFLFLIHSAALAENPPLPTRTSPDPPASSALPAVTLRSVELTLPDVIKLLLQNNRTLRNNTLNRIVQREQLRDAENTFSPKVTPTLGLGFSQTFTNLPNAVPSSTSTVNRTAQIASQLRTPLGTAVTVTVTPLSSQRVALTLSQPILRGAGRRINGAPLELARQTEIRNVLTFRQTLIDQITEATIAYRAIARAQETLKIQQLSIENQRQQLRFIEVLVNANRRPQSELIDLRANLTSAEAQVLTAQNNLQQAKSNLLNLLDLAQPIDIALPQTLIDEFRNGEIAAESVNQLKLKDLLEKAYANRTDFQLAQFDIPNAELARTIARDNQRLNLNLELGANVGDTSDVTAGLSLSQEFGDRTRRTAVTQAEINIQQQQNNLIEVTEAIKQTVEDSLRNVISASQLITATRQAREAAERRLEVATVRFKRGRGADIFQILSLQNDVMTAQNNEVNAKIDFLDALARLDQTIAVTLENWNVQVSDSGVLTPELTNDPKPH